MKLNLRSVDLNLLMVFESQTRRTLVITDLTGMYEEKHFNYEAYRFIVNKGIKTKKFRLRKNRLGS